MVTVDYTMESFLPSEVARLVYGYLEDEGCKDAACEFLNKSSHLKECLLVASKGRKFNSKFYGMNLIDLLELLTEAVSFANEQRKELKLYKAKKKYSMLISFVVENLLSSDDNDEAVEERESDLKSCDSSISILPTAIVVQPKKKERFCNGAVIKLNRKSEGLNPDEVDITDVKIKEENTYGECDVEGRRHGTELEASGELRTLNELPGPPALVKREAQVAPQPQLVCQPYPPAAVLQLVPAAFHPAGPPVYFPQQQLLSLHHQHALPQAIYQTTANSVQSVWTNTKSSSSQISNNHTAVRSPSNSSTQLASSNCKSSSQQCNRSKLRPIAPKLTQSMESVKVHILHTKDKPLVESPSSMSRTLRPRKKMKVLHSVGQSTPNLNLSSQLT